MKSFLNGVLYGLLAVEIVVAIGILIGLGVSAAMIVISLLV